MGDQAFQSAASVGDHWDSASMCADSAKCAAAPDGLLGTRSVGAQIPSGGHTRQADTSRDKGKAHPPCRRTIPLLARPGCVDGLAAFRGHWSGGEIRGRTLIWRQGPSIRIWQMASGQIAVRLDGQVYHGDLGGDELHWDDGDIWTRSAEWESEKFGFSLFSEVQLVSEVESLQSGTNGTVVGFVDQYVEEKFAARICRCLPNQLRQSAASPKAGSRDPSSCAQLQSAGTVPAKPAAAPDDLPGSTRPVGAQVTSWADKVRGPGKARPPCWRTAAVALDCSSSSRLVLAPPGRQESVTVSRSKPRCGGKPAQSRK